MNQWQVIFDIYLSSVTSFLFEIQLTICFSQVEIIMLEVTVVIHHDNIEHTREAKIHHQVVICDP